MNIARTGFDWCIAIQLKLESRELLILNIYTPYECSQNEDEYRNRLGFVSSFIDEYKSTSIFVVGDMNADVSDNQFLFAKHMQQFCEDNNLVVSSQLLLPSDSFTYISEAWHSTSWLDHCISTADAQAMMKSIQILHEHLVSDHVPFVMVMYVKSLPELTQSR